MALATGYYYYNNNATPGEWWRYIEAEPGRWDWIQVLSQAPTLRGIPANGYYWFNGTDENTASDWQYEQTPSASVTAGSAPLENPRNLNWITASFAPGILPDCPPPTIEKGVYYYNSHNNTSPGEWWRYDETPSPPGWFLLPSSSTTGQQLPADGYYWFNGTDVNNQNNWRYQNLPNNRPAPGAAPPDDPRSFQAQTWAPLNLNPGGVPGVLPDCPPGWTPPSSFRLWVDGLFQQYQTRLRQDQARLIQDELDQLFQGGTWRQSTQSPVSPPIERELNAFRHSFWSEFIPWAQTQPQQGAVLQTFAQQCGEWFDQQYFNHDWNATSQQWSPQSPQARQDQVINAALAQMFQRWWPRTQQDPNSPSLRNPPQAPESPEQLRDFNQWFQERRQRLPQPQRQGQFHQAMLDRHQVWSAQQAQRLGGSPKKFDLKNLFAIAASAVTGMAIRWAGKALVAGAFTFVPFGIGLGIAVVAGAAFGGLGRMGSAWVTDQYRSRQGIATLPRDWGTEFKKGLLGGAIGGALGFCATDWFQGDGSYLRGLFSGHGAASSVPTLPVSDTMLGTYDQALKIPGLVSAEDHYKVFENTKGMFESHAWSYSDAAGALSTGQNVSPVMSGWYPYNLCPADVGATDVYFSSPDIPVSYNNVWAWGNDPAQAVHNLKEASYAAAKAGNIALEGDLLEKGARITEAFDVETVQAKKLAADWATWLTQYGNPADRPEAQYFADISGRYGRAMPGAEGKIIRAFQNFFRLG